MARYVVLDPSHPESAYGPVEDAVIIETDLSQDEFGTMLVERSKGWFWLDEMTLSEALATDYELERRLD